MRIAVIGAGYVGLVTGACLSYLGHDVHLWDSDVGKIRMLNGGICPIHEPGLESRIRNMQFHHVLDDSDFDIDVFYIAVGTPSLRGGGVDMSYLASAAQWVNKKLVPGLTQTIVIKSTVPPGTAAMVRGIVDPAFDVVSNPEFLKEGSAISDFANPDRVVIGTDKAKRQDSPFWRIVDIYKGSGVPTHLFLSMTNESAELAKYANNGMLATRISFMNEMSQIAHDVGADIDDVRIAVGSDQRIGPSFLNAGPGWGGSCFPKDLSALAGMSMVPEHHSVVNSAIATNLNQKEYIVRRTLELLPSMGTNKVNKVCVWGVAFKPGTDDTRDSPTLSIVEELIKSGCAVNVHDPIANLDKDWSEKNSVVQFDDMYAAAHGADVVLLITDWPEYKSADWKFLAKSMGGMGRTAFSPPTIFDTRNVLDQGVVPGFLRLARL